MGALVACQAVPKRIASRQQGQARRGRARRGGGRRRPGQGAFRHDAGVGVGVGCHRDEHSTWALRRKQAQGCRQQHDVGERPCGEWTRGQGATGGQIAGGGARSGTPWPSREPPLMTRDHHPPLSPPHWGCASSAGSRKQGVVGVPGNSNDRGPRTLAAFHTDGGGWGWGYNVRPSGQASATSATVRVRLWLKRERRPDTVPIRGWGKGPEAEAIG